MPNEKVCWWFLITTNVTRNRTFAQRLEVKRISGGEISPLSIPRISFSRIQQSCASYDWNANTLYTNESDRSRVCYAIREKDKPSVTVVAARGGSPLSIIDRRKIIRLEEFADRIVLIATTREKRKKRFCWRSSNSSWCRRGHICANIWSHLILHNTV